jgi:NADH:ubiquinone oxidoreductase subunit 6 (subunit J)
VITPTVDVETSSGLNMSIWVALVIFLLIVILVFGMQKKKKNDANPTKTA